MGIFKKKKKIKCSCGGTMVEQTDANVLTGDGIKHYLYKCKKCKKEVIE